MGWVEPLTSGEGHWGGEKSNLSDEIKPGLECGRAGGPFGGADFAGVGGDELGSLHLANEFVRVAAYTVVLNLRKLYLALRINEKAATVCEAFLFDVDSKSSR